MVADFVGVGVSHSSSAGCASFEISLSALLYPGTENAASWILRELGCMILLDL